MPRTKRAEVGWEHPETGEAFRVRCTVSGGSPGRTYGPPEKCHPPEPPEVEVLEVVEDRPGGLGRPDLIALVEADFARIEERAIDEASEPPDWPDTLEEARGEA